MKGFKENFFLLLKKTFNLFKNFIEILELIDFLFCSSGFHLTNFVPFRKTKLMGNLISRQVRNMLQYTQSKQGERS